MNINSFKILYSAHLLYSCRYKNLKTGSDSTGLIVSDLETTTLEETPYICVDTAGNRIQLRHVISIQVIGQRYPQDLENMGDIEEKMQPPVKEPTVINYDIEVTLLVDNCNNISFMPKSSSVRNIKGINFEGIGIFMSDPDMSFRYKTYLTIDSLGAYLKITIYSNDVYRVHLGSKIYSPIDHHNIYAYIADYVHSLKSEMGA